MLDFLKVRFRGVIRPSGEDFKGRLLANFFPFVRPRDFLAQKVDLFAKSSKQLSKVESSSTVAFCNNHRTL